MDGLYFRPSMSRKGYYSKRNVISYIGPYHRSVHMTVRDLLSAWRYPLSKHSQQYLKRHQSLLVNLVHELVVTSSWHQLNVLTYRVWNRKDLWSSLRHFARTHLRAPRTVFTDHDHTNYFVKWLIPKGLRGFPRITSRTQRVLGCQIGTEQYTLMQNSVINAWNYRTIKCASYIRLSPRYKLSDGFSLQKHNHGCAQKMNMFIRRSFKTEVSSSLSSDFDDGESWPSDLDLTSSDDYSERDW